MRSTPLPVMHRKHDGLHFPGGGLLQDLQAKRFCRTPAVLGSAFCFIWLAKKKTRKTFPAFLANSWCSVPDLCLLWTGKTGFKSVLSDAWPEQWLTVDMLFGPDWTKSKQWEGLQLTLPSLWHVTPMKD